MKRKHFFKKRALSLLLALTMCAGMMPSAFAAEEEKSEVGADTNAASISSDETLPEEKEDINFVIAPASTDDDANTNDDAYTDAVADADADADADGSVTEGEDSNKVPEFPVNGSEAEKQDWYIENVERPEQSDTVTTSPEPGPDDLKPSTGEPIENPVEIPENWKVFYDQSTGSYQLTYEIAENAQGDQTIDLTKALDFLNHYAQTSGSAYQNALDEIEKDKPSLSLNSVGTKPVKDEILNEATNAFLTKNNISSVPTEPDIPPKFDKEKPEDPGKEPEQPGMTPEMQATLSDVESAFTDYYFDPDLDPNAWIDETDVLKIMEKQGLDTTNSYIQDYAKYVFDKTEAIDCLNVLNDPKAPQYLINYIVEGHSPVNLRDEDGNLIREYTPDERKEMAYAALEKTIANVPEYPIDEGEYAAYEEAKSVYDAKKSAYDEWLKEKEAFDKEHEGEDAEYDAALAMYRAYQEALVYANEKYTKAIANYNTQVDGLKEKYNKDWAAYSKKIADLNKQYISWIEANVLQPGDVRKFEIYLTSQSGHTYKYKEGSFTLATPEWNESGTATNAFDGQELLQEYIDTHQYYVTVASEPIQDLFEKIHMADPNNPVNKGNVENGKVGLGYDGKGNITVYPDYWDYEINSFLNEYDGETIADKLNSYILSYYVKEDGTTYASIDELVKNNPEAAKELTKTATSGNKEFKIGGEKFVVQAHNDAVLYNNFYQNLISFVYGDKTELDKVMGTGELKGNGFWEYANDSWTDEGKRLALAYYMSHQDAWKTTEAYFQQLLDKGLSKDESSWKAFMMAMNLDGELTGNDWQLTKWGWYNSFQLEQMDYDFSLTKTDSETGEIISDSETGFQLWYIDTQKDADGNVVKDENGNDVKVNMYCSRSWDEEKQEFIYTFTPTAATIQTVGGKLEILKQLMKDTAYYLQEKDAPEGYVADPTIYVIIDKDTFEQMSPELGDGYAWIGDIAQSEGSMEEGNFKWIVSDFGNDPIPENPPQTPDDPDEPDEPDTPDTPDEPTPEIPDEPTPLTDFPEEPEQPTVEVPEEPVPLAEIPEEEVPLAEIPEEPVPLADVPMTGDGFQSTGLLILFGCAALGWLALSKKRENEI